MMVARGIKKSLNHDPIAQMESIDRANQAYAEAKDKQRLRRSIAWYHAPSGQWLEVELAGFFSDMVVFMVYPDKPERFIDTGWGINQKREGQPDLFYRLEGGFIADGLPHAVWIVGGRWHRGRYAAGCTFDHDKSKFKLFQHLISGITKLPALFLEIYDATVSIPALQKAWKTYQDNPPEDVDSSGGD